MKFWTNGKPEIIKSPIKPYCYGSKYIPSEAKSTLVNKQLLYNKTNTDPIYKLEFNTWNQLRECCNSNDFYESTLSFIDRVFIDAPELLNKYANTDNLKILYFDIETDSQNILPNAEDNAIIAIGYQFNDKPIQILMSETYNDDKDILQQFINDIKKYDPDLVVGYNSTFFDLPYICSRMKKNGIDPACLTRDNTQPYITDRYAKLNGRVHYDIYTRSVDKDQNLFKWAAPNKKMKTVVRLYGLKNVIEEDQSTLANMRSIVNTQELHDYLTSDIRATKYLSDIYLPALINLAEILNVPLESCINSSPSYVGHMLFFKHFSELGIISDGTVGEMYPELKEKSGATVGSYAPGLYKNKIFKYDIVSFYPHEICTFNLSPETCSLVDINDNIQDFSTNMNDETKILTLSIPDYNLNKQLIIEIDFSKVGFASSFVLDLMEKRLQLKKLMKTLPHDSPEYADADVNQLNIKIILNSITGFYALEYAHYGSASAYCSITGCGRYIISKIMEHIGNIIATDTDGTISSNDLDINDVNTWLEQFILDTFKVPKNYIRMEKETFEAGYFRAENKQYLLIEKGQNTDEFELIVHGASYKGSNLPKLYSRIIVDIGKQMLLLDDSDSIAVKQFEQNIANYYDKSTWILEDIKKRNKCKPISQYKSAGTIGGQLVSQYEKRFKTSIKTDTQLEYVKVKRNHGSEFQLITVFDKIEDIIGIDYNYYEEIVDSAFERLG
ncbi:MAG: ribonuclease H-like domain-containing protein, partial [Candidatus Cloacimonetes bacterium]|nr:ribonuclease H-like domain-containing protein [Candidatus Cloacimonadota bacterium]